MKKQIYILLSFFLFLFIVTSSSGVCHDCVLKISPKPGMYWMCSPFIRQHFDKVSYVLINEWQNKSFPNLTVMQIGYVMQHPGILFCIMAMNSTEPSIEPSIYPHYIDVYIDGVVRATLNPVPIRNQFGKVMYYIYLFVHTDRGFHHITFTPMNETGHFDGPDLYYDAQIGWNGFFQHIYPYLKN